MRSVLAMLTACAGLVPAALGQCVPAWTPVLAGGPDGPVNALLVFDDGSGAALFAAGTFDATAYSSPNVVRFRPSGAGGAWQGLAGGRANPAGLLSLATHDEGSGAHVFVAGFSAFPGSTLSRWTGAAWEWVDAPASWIGVIASWAPPGAAPQLYASGTVFAPNPTPPDSGYLARRVGGSWVQVGGGFETVGWAFLEHNDGRGRSLFAAGNFFSSAGVVLNGVGRWDGAAWSALGSGLSGVGEMGRCLAVFDDGSGPALYAGGDFSAAGGVTASRIAKWNGQSWSALGSGLNAEVFALTVFDDGAGAGLVAGGSFTMAGGHPAAHLAMWRQGQWSALGAGLNGVVNALAVLDPDGSGPVPAYLVAGGEFAGSSGVASPNVAAYRGCACYANCDSSTTAPVLNIADFGCFLQRFAAASAYANCDASTAPPTLNVADFTCFLQRFAAGCP